MGYPTANIPTPDDAPEGVFAGIVVRGKTRHLAMIFIGKPVTLNDNVRRAEANILDFPDQDLYRETLDFELLHHVRDNKKFDSLDELIAAIKDDESAIREYFKKHPQIN